MARKTGDAGKVCRGSSDRSGGLAKTALMAVFKYLEWECDVMMIIELNVSVRDRQREGQREHGCVRRRLYRKRCSHVFIINQQVY